MTTAAKTAILTAVLALLLIAASLSFGDLKQLKPGAKEKCPVCGMFVAKYPDFAAQIRFREGATFHFDGAKDMFKFYLNPSRYVPGRKQGDVAAVFVTNYYDLSMIDGSTAYYVVGSDVSGPMGRELIPHASEREARAFLNDHKGKGIYRFRDVTPALLRTLD